MRQSARNSGNTSRLLNQLASQKKKTVLALCLITLMAFMWIRVFTRKAPQAAEAGLLAGQMEVETQSEPELKISFVELPQAAGRNDVITRDFFASDGWQHFVDREGRKSAGVEEAKKLVKPVLSATGVIQSSTAATSGISAGQEGVPGETGGDSMALHDTLVIYDRK